VFNVVSDAPLPSTRPLAPPSPPGLDSPRPPSELTVAPGPPARAPRAGELTLPWRVVMIVTWVAAFIAYMAVWKASEEVGIGTWWLGPRSNPQPMLVRLVPFLIAAVFGVLASYNVRRFPWISLGGSAVLAVVAVPDLSRSTGLAVIEFAIAGAVAVVSLAASTGMYRADGDRPMATDR